MFVTSMIQNKEEEVLSKSPPKLHAMLDWSSLGLQQQTLRLLN